MPSAYEEFARLLREQTDRIDRLENAEYREAVPNPIVEPAEGTVTTETEDTVSVESSHVGSFQWSESWSTNTWSGIPFYTEGFESGLTDWTVASGATLATDTTASRVHEGSTSAHATTSDSNGLVAASDVWPDGGGTQISTFSFSYMETTNSSGGGFRLKNSSGGYELGMASDNPEWSIDDGEGFVQYVGSGQLSPSYDVWNTVTVWFDWSAGTYTLEWTRPDRTTEFYRRDAPLITGENVETLELWDHTGEVWQSSSLDMWVDSITLS